MQPGGHVLSQIEGRLIVSCQALEGSPFRHPGSMARFAEAAAKGGAGGIRANGPEDVRSIRAITSLPIIGIRKSKAEDGNILITGLFEDARALVEAGAGIIALDCTARGQRYGALERLARIRRELHVPVMADIATLGEALAAAEAGADLVGTTMRGYTPETAHIGHFDEPFLRDLVRRVAIPVVAEGRVATPGDAAAAIAAGAFAVVVGTAITNPEEITHSFVRGIGDARRRTAPPEFLLAIDMGATSTKFGVVSASGELLRQGAVPTPSSGGAAGLIAHLKQVAAAARVRAEEARVRPSALGVATAGWVDPHSGSIVYATGNLPGWTGAPIAEELHAAVGLPVTVENDANAVAVAEKRFGLARDAGDFVSITLGTGIGGGVYAGGRLCRGAHFFANAIGHIPIETDGAPCTCGQRGCLEAYANAAAMLRYAGGRFDSAEKLIQAANAGDAAAAQSIRACAHYLAAGAAIVIELLDPEMLIFSGGLTQNNPILLEQLRAELPGRVGLWEQRRIRVEFSRLGYHAGVLGAAAVALEA